MKKLDSLMFGWILGGSIVLVSGTLFAQGEAPAAPTAAPTATAPAAPPPAAPEATIAAPAAEPAPAETAAPAATEPPAATGETSTSMAVGADTGGEAAMGMEATTTEPEPTEAMPADPVAEEEWEQGPVNVGGWGRVDFTLQDPEDPEKLGDVGSTGLLEAHFSGKVMEHVGWTGNLVAAYGGGPGTVTGTAALLDGIVELGFHDSFNVWAGRMLVASDRSNFSGPWFMMAWDYPGLYVAGAPPIGPHQGPYGRNDGATVWGNIMDGHLKYYVGAFDLFDATTTPLYTARLNLSLINPEPGFYSNSTYLGDKDLLALGVGFQTKAGQDVIVDSIDPMTGMTVSTMDTRDDYSLFNMDLLFEKNFGENAGTLNAEAAFYSFSGDDETVETHMFGVLSYLIPGNIGPGQLMPLARFQTATERGTDETWTTMEGYLNYIPNGFNFNTSLGFVSTSLGGAGPDGDDLKSNAVKLGLQVIH